MVYDIHIDEFAKQGDAWLFRFRFDGRPVKCVQTHSHPFSLSRNFDQKIEATDHENGARDKDERGYKDQTHERFLKMSRGNGMPAAKSFSPIFGTMPVARNLPFTRCWLS